MGIRDFFSKRVARAAKAGKPDVYQYAVLPSAFRVQVVHIWDRAVGNFVDPWSRHSGPPESIWDRIELDVAEEHGLFRLRKDSSSYLRVVNYFLGIEDTDRALDVIEAVFTAIDEHIRPNLQYATTSVSQHPDDAIQDLNRRFREHGIGFYYADGQIMRVDSQYIHCEAVKPALALLSEPGFAGPQDEFLRAHKHYREGKYKEAINEALKAFESTLKAICDQRRWHYDKNRDTVKTLIEIVFREELIPPFLQNAFSGLRSVLEGAVPTTRNRTSGHGQGAEPKEVPEYFVAYVLHVAASNIVLLVEAHKARPGGRI